MTPPVVHPLDVSFVLAVTAAAWVFPPLALAVGAAFFGLNGYLLRQERIKQIRAAQEAASR